MIVKNEAVTLPRCLESVQGVVDEMVILDTGSSDRTIDIAHDFGAQVHSYVWCDDFAAARNQSLQYVHGDWVLVLDADEILVPEIIPQLQQTLHHPDYLVINLMRQEVGARQAPYTLISRLFRRHPKIQFSRPYHELVDDSIVAIQAQEPHWQVGYLPTVAIHHDGYQPHQIALRDKQHRGQRIMERYLEHHPQDAYLCSKLGALYLNLDQIPKGIALLQRGLDTEPTDAAVVYELHYHLANAMSKLGHRSQAQTHYRAALQQPLPDRLKLGAYNNWASLQKEQGDLEGACQLYKQILAIQPDLAIAHNNLGLTLKATGDLTASIAAYQRAIQLQPNYAEAHQNLGVALLKRGNLKGSLAAFQTAIALHEQQQNPQEANRLRQGLNELGFRP